MACGNEKVFGVDYALTFTAVMDMTAVKMILDLAATWGVPAKHGDVPNTYVKAEKEHHLEILMHVPKGMTIGKGKLKYSELTATPKSCSILRRACMG